MAQGMIMRRGGGGSATTPLIITLIMNDGTSAAGRTITITNTDDDSVIAQIVYTGQPHTEKIQINIRYRISVDECYYYAKPEDVCGIAYANTQQIISMTYTRGVRYGFKREKANSAPAARITYLFDAEGMTPAYMDFAADAFNWGDWKEFVEKVARPVMLKTDGTVDYELDHDDQTKKLDGTDSDVDNVDYDGNAMVEFGKAFQWVKRYEDSEFEYVIFCDAQFDETYHAYAHTNEAGDVQDAFYWGMFKGSLYEDRLRSLKGTTSVRNVTRQTEIARAVANGDGYYIIYKSGRDYINDLLTLISKSDNGQTVFGNGRISGSSSTPGTLLAPGTLVSKPAFYGKSTVISDVKVFWIEGYWGNFWESLAGFINNAGNGIKAKMVPPYNLTGEGYVETGLVISGSSASYISTESVTDEAGLVPTVTGGSSTIFLCDGLWKNNNVVGYALIGGDVDYGALCGPHTVSFYHGSDSRASDIGSRLSYIRPSA